MAINYIDGPRLARAIESGAQWVASKHTHLNEINVFPVPDGDTGTNLTMTLKAASDAVQSVSGRSLGEVTAAISRAVLYGARGNAGIILAQFLRGFAREVQGVERLYPKSFAEALERSVDGAYGAMTEPVEGTILTVLRESADEVSRLVEGGEFDYTRILEGMHRAAVESVSRTPDLLPVLKEAGVVDAGGEGFADLLEGMLRLLRGEEVGNALDSLLPAAEAVLPDITERDLKYRYCTEFVVEGPDANVADLKIKLAGLGGSVVVLGGTGLVRAHVHTNEPERVFAAAVELGEVSEQKVDDMRQQHHEFVRDVIGGRRGESQTAHRPHAARRRAARDRRRHVIRIVTDSTADLDPEVAADLGIAVVPLSVNFGEESFRDGVDLTSEEFYTKLAEAPTLPTTSQPTPQDFLTVYEELGWETRAILSIHISSAMSGTAQSATLAADEVEGVTVRVIDSRLVSAPLGLVVLEAARAAAGGAEFQEVATLASNLSARGRVLFTVGSLDYLAKGGRIGRAKALVGKLARVKPVLTVENGVIEPVGKARGDRGVMDRMLELAAVELAGGSGGTLGVLHAERPEMIPEIEEAFREKFGFDEVAVFGLGGIVGTHAGPGTWGVSYFRRRRAP